MSILKSKLKFVKLCVSLKAKEDCMLPEFTGSLLRGSFGHALKKSFCEEEARLCGSCGGSNLCGYFQIFESQDDSFKKIGYHYKPHPYIITPSLKNQFKVGDILQFEITLFGDSTKYLSYLIPAFKSMGTTGLGKDRKEFILLKVKDSLSGNLIYENDMQLDNQLKELSIQDYAQKSTFEPNQSSFTIKFLTPGRFAENGRVLKTIPGKMLMESIIRRYTTMHSFYGELSKEDTYLKNLDIHISANQISFKKWNRYSNRQERKVQQSGILGIYDISNITEKIFYLFKTMEILHIGKNTSFGLGKIKLISEKLVDPDTYFGCSD